MAQAAPLWLGIVPDPLLPALVEKLATEVRLNMSVCVV